MLFPLPGILADATPASPKNSSSGQWTALGLVTDLDHVVQFASCCPRVAVAFLKCSSSVGDVLGVRHTRQLGQTEHGKQDVKYLLSMFMYLTWYFGSVGLNEIWY